MLLLQLPKRPRDELDALALALICPICGARRCGPCLWPAAALPSWLLHDERRALIWLRRVAPRSPPG